MTMCHASLVAAVWKMYSLPSDWFYGLTLLRHVLGVGMIALQLWTAVSIYESLGEFGWFCGDFFFDPPQKNLTYSGIYRFLNNPERVLGLTGIWGMALITWNAPIFYLAATAHILNLAFLQFVERPHMQALYGQRLRELSGVSKTFRQALPSPVRMWQSAADDYINSSVEFIEEMLEMARPKITASVDALVKDTTALFKLYPTRLPAARPSAEVTGLDRALYKLEIEGALLPAAVEYQKSGGREGELARAPAARTSQFQTLTFEYGAPITVRWQAPATHSSKDWIGLYMVADNQSREVTRLSSNGRWVATNRGVYDSVRAEEGIVASDVPDRTGESESEVVRGEVCFSGDKLWWTTGVFEFRYHHGGKHSVMALSQAFEVGIARFEAEEAEVDGAGTVHVGVEQALLPVVQKCFDRDPEIAPDAVDEAFGGVVEREGKYAQRVVFAVQHM
jgi:phosphatidylethanolamine N-methyltransferase